MHEKKGNDALYSLVANFKNTEDYFATYREIQKKFDSCENKIKNSSVSCNAEENDVFDCVKESESIA